VRNIEEYEYNEKYYLNNVNKKITIRIKLYFKQEYDYNITYVLIICK